jgi:hypothetical protein
VVSWPFAGSSLQQQTLSAAGCEAARGLLLESVLCQPLAGCCSVGHDTGMVPAFLKHFLAQAMMAIGWFTAREQLDVRCCGLSAAACTLSLCRILLFCFAVWTCQLAIWFAAGGDGRAWPKLCRLMHLRQLSSPTSVQHF